MMLKKSIVMSVILSCVTSYVAAANQFSVITESDSKDYIGGGKGRTFSAGNKDKITVSNADTKNAQFAVESFILGTPMKFTFGVEDGKTLEKGLYDPAKRHPFRGSYNGIEVSGDGRGCNTIVGRFYVHEYTVSADGIVDKAAIDFVQYCEGGTAGLYGSLRYNSTIASSCSKAGSCNGVKKILNIGSSKDATVTPSDTVTTDTNVLKKIYKKKYKTFTAFMQGEYKMTYRKDFKNVNKYCKINKLFDSNKNSKNFFMNNACGTNYNDVLKDFNEGFVEGVEDGSDSDGELSKETILDIRKGIREIQLVRKTSDLTTKEDMTLSIAILGLMRVDYIIHSMLFSL